MAKGVYKPGQGYWVRTMTAVFAGALILAAAAWAFAEAARVEDSLPVERWSMTTRPASGQPPEAGATVRLTTPDPETGDRMGIGEHEVLSVEPGAQRGVYLLELSPNLADPVIEATAGGGEREITAADARRIESADGAFSAELSQRIRIESIPVTYVQAGVAMAIILLGAALLYWFVALNRGSVEFLIATDGEMRKVNWSTRREVIGSTQVVIVAAFLIAGILFVVDIGFGSFFRWIDVLQS